jgi:hypothetical protein
MGDDVVSAAVRDLLGAMAERVGGLPAEDRVAAIRLLAEGFDVLEHQVVFGANDDGVSWAQIGRLYGVSRQAAHHRFGNLTFVPSELFNSLMDDVDDDEPIPALAEAMRRAAGAVKTREGVPY